MTQTHTTNQDYRFRLRSTFIFVLVLLLTALFIPSSSSYAFTVDGPEAVIDITKYDAGDVFAGEDIEYSFFVRNAGTKVLELKEKSAISFYNRGPAYTPSIAVWRPQERIFVHTAAAVRAAPS